MDCQLLVYRALRDVSIGDELCISYGRLWFTDTDEEHSRAQSPTDEDACDTGLDRIESFP